MSTMRTMSTIYIDVDGTLLSSKLDREFQSHIAADGLDAAIAWYDDAVNVSDLYINYELVREIWLGVMRGDVRFVLWTNRGPNQVEMTKRNLGRYWFLFSEHQFYTGKKSKSVVEGEVWDNEAKYAMCGTSFRHITFEA